MSIAFEPEEVQLQKLRERLRQMSDDELVQLGKAARSLCRNRDCPEMFKRQLEEARSEWVEAPEGIEYAHAYHSTMV